MKNKKLNINIFMFIFFFLLLFTLGIDYITYFLKTNYIISFFISLVLNSVISYFILKKIKLELKFKKSDLIFFGALFLIFAITIVFPDRTFDTFNYHLYLQENPFGDKIGLDFFAGKNLNSFTYAFPDRIFYIFRFFLGYRLGVILNYLLITVVYYQVKNIFENLIPKSKEITRSIFSLLIALSLSIIDIVDSYYIDIISLVLLLEILRLVLTEKIDDDNNSILIGYFALLFSFSFIVKISNAPMLVLFFIIYVIKNRNIVKYINLKNILIAILLLVLPCILYIVYTFIQTGNPVFPFYNTIFKSKYFGNRNWLDTRFGPHSLIGVFAYPVMAIFHPERTCDLSIYEPIWGYGYIVSILYIGFYAVKKFILKTKIDSNRLLLAVTTFFIYIIWAKFQLGYTRYGFISLVAGSIMTYLLIYDLFKNKKYVLTCIVCIFMFFSFKYSIEYYAFMKHDWIYNNYINNKAANRHNFTYNIKNVLARGNEVKVDFEKDSVWGIVYNNSGLAQMINSNIPIINLNDGADNKYTKELLNKKINKASHIYTLVDSLDFDNFIRRLNKAQYKIVKVKDVISPKIIGRRDSYTYIFELKKEKYKNNNESIDLKKTIDVSKYSNISFYLGLDKWTNNIFMDDINITISADGKVIDNVKLDNHGKMKLLKYDIKEYKKLTIESKDTWLLILNMELK